MGEGMGKNLVAAAIERVKKNSGFEALPILHAAYIQRLAIRENFKKIQGESRDPVFDTTSSREFVEKRGFAPQK